MKKYRVKVLFKNGIEKSFVIEADDVGVQSVISTIKLVYKGNNEGVMSLGGAFVNLGETACVEFGEL